MVRGFYAAASGLITNQKILNVTGTNAANSTTAGYKNDKVTTTSFGEHLTYKLDNHDASPVLEVGGTTNGAAVHSIYTDFTQGNLRQTQSPFNLAIAGQGFFTLTGDNGQISYTRNGEFALNGEGFIVNSDGKFLTGANGPINTGGRDFEVSLDGGVYVDGQLIDTLAIYNPADTATMQKLPDGTFTDTANNQIPFTGTIQQGYLESSNADAIEQMMDMMSTQRAFQSSAQALKMIDETIKDAVTELAKKS